MFSKIPSDDYFIITLFTLLWYVFLYLIILNFFRAKVSYLYFEWRKARTLLEKNVQENDAFNFTINSVDRFLKSIKKNWQYMRVGFYGSKTAINKLLAEKDTLMDDKKSRFKNKNYFNFDKNINEPEFEPYTSLVMKKAPKYTRRMQVLTKSFRFLICSVFSIIAIITLMGNKSEDLLIKPFQKYKHVLEKKNAVFYGVESLQRFLIDGLPDFLGNQTRRMTYDKVSDSYIQTSTSHIISSYLWQASRYSNVTNENDFKGFFKYKQTVKLGNPVPPTFHDGEHKFVTQYDNVTFADKAKTYSSYPTTSNAHYWNIPNNNSLVAYFPYKDYFYAFFNVHDRKIKGNFW